MKHLSKQKKKEYANNPRYNEVFYIEFPLNSNDFMVHTAAHLGQIICFYEVSQATKPDYSPNLTSLERAFAVYVIGRFICTMDSSKEPFNAGKMKRDIFVFGRKKQWLIVDTLYSARCPNSSL